MTVRKSSTRCKNKLLRSYAGTTLIDIALNKISKIDDHEVFVGAYEREFKEKIKSYPNITLIERSKESAYITGSEQNAGKKLFEMYNKLDHKWIFWINPCHAFLKIKTIQKAIKKFSQIPNRSMTSVKKLNGWYYDKNGKPLNHQNDSYMGVRETDYLYIADHAFHAYERTMPLKGKYWDNIVGDPYLYTIDYDEAYDIDTEDDFLISEALYKSKIKI